MFQFQNDEIVCNDLPHKTTIFVTDNRVFIIGNEREIFECCNFTIVIRYDEDAIMQHDDASIAYLRAAYYDKNDDWLATDTFSEFTFDFSKETPTTIRERFENEFNNMIDLSHCDASLRAQFLMQGG